MDDLKTIVSLYKRFDRYSKCKDIDILLHILPSFILKQYKIHKQGDEVVAFTNWAFLDDASEKLFISTGRIAIDKWNSGKNVWHVDTLCVKNLKKVMSWSKDYFTKLLGLNKPVHWLRVNSNDKIYRKATRYTKEHWKWDRQ